MDKDPRGWWMKARSFIEGVEGVVVVVEEEEGLSDEEGRRRERGELS